MHNPIENHHVICNDCYKSQKYSDLYKEETYPYVLYYCDFCLSPDLNKIGTNEKINSLYLMTIHFPKIKQLF